MIEADNASTSIYQVLRMSRAAKTHLLILKRSYKEGRGHPYYTSGDVPTRCPAEFLSLSIMVKWMTDANNSSNVISKVKRTPLAAMTHLLISSKGALRRPITYITTVKRHWNEM